MKLTKCKTCEGTGTIMGDYPFSDTCPDCKGQGEVEEEVILYRCPKFQKCVMDCHHRELHKHDKWCSATHIDDVLSNSPECPHCVEEIKSDITFFPEDFEID